MTAVFRHTWYAKVHAKTKTKLSPALCPCSDACPGRGRRRRRPCSSVRDAQLRCASGKRKHGPARARAPQRSTLKDPIIFLARSEPFCGGGADQYFSVSNLLTLESADYRIYGGMENENTAQRGPSEGLCSNACSRRGSRRRRPCSSVQDVPMSCASGKRKHGRARACVPQRSTLKEYVPSPGRSLFVAFCGGGASQYFSMSGVLTLESQRSQIVLASTLSYQLC